MCQSMVNIQSPTAEIRRGKKKKKKEERNRMKIYMVSLLHRATIKQVGLVGIYIDFSGSCMYLSSLNCMHCSVVNFKNLSPPITSAHMMFSVIFISERYMLSPVRHPLKILWRLSQGNASAGGLNTRGS